MNSRELMNEIAKDYPMVLRKAIYLTENMRREAVKSKSKSVSRIFNYKSKQLNNWFIISHHIVDIAYYAVVVYYLDNHGLNGIAVSPESKEFIHFTPHFLERYNERFLKQEYIEKNELLKHFITHNALGTGVHAIDDDEIKYENFVRFNEGIGLGYVEQFNDISTSIVHHKTFISNEMIHCDQKKLFELSGDEQKRYWEENYRQLNKDPIRVAS